MKNHGERRPSFGIFSELAAGRVEITMPHYSKNQVAKIKGSQGSWEAEVTYPDERKEVLACLHQYYMKGGPSGPTYNDPWTPELRISTKFAKHVELIRSKGRVILTSDDINEGKGRGGGFFSRTGYIAVYGIDDFIIDDEGMRLRFTDRIINAK